MKTQNEDYGYYWATKSHLYHHLSFDWVRYDSQGFQGFDKSIGKWIKMRGEFEADKDILEEMGQPNIVGVLAKIAERLGYTGPFYYDECNDSFYEEKYRNERLIYRKGEWLEIESSKPFNDPEPKYKGRESVAEKIIDQIKNDAKNPKIEQRLFTTKSIGKYITLYQDFNRIEISFSASNSNNDEQNIIIHLCLIFWAIEVAFEWRPFKRR